MLRSKSVRSLLLMAVAFAAAPAAFSYSPERALDELSMEMAQCSAYYFLVARRVEGLPKETSADYENLSLQARLQAMELTSAERTEEQIQISMREVVQRLGADNWNALLQDNHTSCSALMDDPKPRLKYWINKAG